MTLLRSKCVPILLYATEACPTLSREKQSMDFAVTRLFMKMFKTVSPAIVIECQRSFNFLPISQQLNICTAKFLQRFIASENVVCTLFSSVAASQLKDFFLLMAVLLIMLANLLMLFLNCTVDQYFNLIRPILFFLDR